MKQRKGQAIVEFALVFPLFLLIIIGGIIDFGFAFYNHLTLQQIANSTAKYAAYTKAGQDKVSEYANSLKPQWWKGKFTVLASKPQDLKTGGKIHQVSLSYGSATYTPFYSLFYKLTSENSCISLYSSAAYKAPEFSPSTQEKGFPNEKKS